MTPSLSVVGLADSRHRFTAALGAGLALAALLVAATQIGARGDTASAVDRGAPPATPAGEYSKSLLGGIPQHGTALGSPKAPVTLVEYADLQCPYCGQWARATLPTLVDRYVRPGKLRIVFSGLAFVGPESNTALHTALAAAPRGHLWDIVDGLYVRQGLENSGWVTDGLIREIVAGVPGLDADRLLHERWDAPITAEVDRAARRAEAADVNSTPSFELGPTRGPLERIQITSTDPGGIVPAIEKALAR
jgi:protein-disulfide isomerase